MSAIAFIGLGQMGAPMAKNLLKQGHQLNVFDVNPQAVQALVESGARAAATPSEILCDPVFPSSGLFSSSCVMRVPFPS